MKLCSPCKWRHALTDIHAGHLTKIQLRQWKEIGVECYFTLAGQQASMEVQVQPLHLQYRPGCLARLSGLLSQARQDTQSARLTQATNKLQGLDAHVLAQAQRVLKLGSMPAISIQVLMVLLCVPPFSIGCWYLGAWLHACMSCTPMHNQDSCAKSEDMRHCVYRWKMSR